MNKGGLISESNKEELASVDEVLRDDHSDDQEALSLTDISTCSTDNSSVSNNSVLSSNNDCNFNRLDFLYTNARSLAPKITSLIELFDNWNLHFAAVTETWLADCGRYRRNVQKLEDKENLVMVTKNRKSRGGGVAIIYNKSKIILKPLNVRKNNFELVAAVGRTVSDARRVLVLAAYYPPQMRKEQVDALNDCISSTIDRQKEIDENLCVVVCGDMNQKNIDQVLVDHPEVTVLQTPSTRKGETIDLCLTNIAVQCSATKLPPLETMQGQKSDHDCILVRSKTERRHIFSKKRFTFRPYSEEKADSFARELAVFDWAPIHALEVNEAVEMMDKVLSSMYARHFPEKTKTVKSSDPPWMSRKVKKASEKKRKYFRKKGKNTTWKRIEADTEQVVKQAKIDFLDKVNKTVREAKNMSAFFKAVKLLGAKDPQTEWNVRKLFPGDDDEVIADKCVEFFSDISREYEPVGRPPPNGPTEWKIELHEISSRLKHCKKPKGQVDGDLRPELVTKCHDLLAISLQHIFNQVLESCVWPDKWKLETVKIIPKIAIPETIKDVRNISCTPLYSKVLEFFVLKKLRQHISLADNQFGGIKGVGIDHFLCETWHEILTGLDDGNSAASLVSIDFSKAFNRMDHHECIEALRGKGVPGEVVSVVQAFLHNRRMAVHVNGKKSKIMAAPGGAPQGSVLGSFLFCATTERLLSTNDLNTTPTFQENGDDDQEIDIEREGPISPIAPPNGRTMPMWAELELENQSDSDDSINLGIRQERQRLLDTTVESYRASQSAIGDFLELEEWQDAPPTIKAYIDDFNVVEKVRTTTALCHISTNKTTYQVHAPGSEGIFKNVKRTANDMGMIVNENKTQMLAIHPKGSLMSTYIHADDGTKICSGRDLKILGFTFGNTPDLAANTAIVMKKFISKLWSMRRMKGAGMNQKDMLATYKAVLRPTLDFASAAYHSMLTAEQSTLLERQQLRAMKIIYGENVSYGTVLRSGSVQLLSERREELLRNLALRAEKLPRCKKWFPENRNIDHNLRRREKYFIPRLKTERARKSPIIRMRQILNEMHS